MPNMEPFLELMFEEIVVHYSSQHTKANAETHHPPFLVAEIPMMRSDEAESQPGSGEGTGTLVED